MKNCCAAGFLRIIQREYQRNFNSLAVLTNLEAYCASEKGIAPALETRIFVSSPNYYRHFVRFFQPRKKEAGIACFLK